MMDTLGEWLLQQRNLRRLTRDELCAKIRKGLDHADFNAKRQIIQLLNIRGKIAFENGEKVLYLKCLIDFQEQQAVSRLLTSPSQYIDWQNSIELTAKFFLRQIGPLLMYFFPRW